MLDAREGVLPTAEEKALSKLLRLLIRFGDESRQQISEILRARLVAVLQRLIGVQIPHIASRGQRGAEAEIRMTLLGAPSNRLGT